MERIQGVSAALLLVTLLLLRRSRCNISLLSLQTVRWWRTTSPWGVKSTRWAWRRTGGWTDSMLSCNWSSSWVTSRAPGLVTVCMDHRLYKSILMVHSMHYLTTEVSWCDLGWLKRAVLLNYWTLKDWPFTLWSNKASWFISYPIWSIPIMYSSLHRTSRWEPPLGTEEMAGDGEQRSSKVSSHLVTRHKPVTRSSVSTEID